MRRLADLPAPESVCAGGETLTVRRLGAGPRLLLLHGGPGLDHHVLLPLACELAARHEVWLPDLPGHGRLASPPPSLQELQERLASWVAHVEVHAFGGHSLGAWLARELLRARVLTPQATVLLCPPGPLRGPAWRRVPLAPADESLDGLRAALLAELRARGPIDPLLEQAVACATLRSAARYPQLEVELLRVLRGAIRPVDPRCPVLVIAGAEDATAPPGTARAVAAATRGATLRVLDRAGHYLWSRSPRPTAAVVAEFLERNCR